MAEGRESRVAEGAGRAPRPVSLQESRGCPVSERKIFITDTDSNWLEKLLLGTRQWICRDKERLWAPEEDRFCVDQGRDGHRGLGHRRKRKVSSLVSLPPLALRVGAH